MRRRLTPRRFVWSEKPKLRLWRLSEYRRPSVCAWKRRSTRITAKRRYSTSLWMPCRRWVYFLQPSCWFLRAVYLRVMPYLSPQIAAEVAAPLARTEEIVLLGGSDATSGELTRLVGQVPPAVQALTGVDLSKVSQSISFPLYFLVRKLLIRGSRSNQLDLDVYYKGHLPE